MNLTEAEKFCHNWLPAWSGNSPDKLISFYSQQSYYADPVVKQGLNGYDEIFPYFKKLLKNNPRWCWTYKEIFPTDKGFILKWKATIPVGDIEVIEFGMDIVEIVNKHITRNEIYFDTLNLFKAYRNKL
jgi:hypothetical protein